MRKAANGSPRVQAARNSLMGDAVGLHMQKAPETFVSSA